MATLLLSSVKSCEGGHGLSHHLLEKRRTCHSGPLKERVMTMVIFFLSPVESCGGGPRRSSEVCPLSPQSERSMTIPILSLHQ